MSSARLALTFVGQVVGSAFGAVGSAIGGAIGGFIGGNIDGPQKGPRLDDTRSPAIEFGATCPRVYGRVWVTLSPLWWSKLRESTANSGGKGAADQTVDNYVYHADMLGRLADGSNVIGWTRIRIDGKLVGTNLADSSAESLEATATTELWSDVELFTGGPTQTPWSVMEAVDGAGNVSAYRDQCTIGFTNLLWQNGRAPSLIEVEVITKGELGGALTLLQSRFIDDADDESAYEHGAPDIDGTPSIGGGNAVFDYGAAELQRLRYPVVNPNGIDAVTFEAIINWTSTQNVTSTPILEFTTNTALPGTTHIITFYGDAGRLRYDIGGFGNVWDSGAPIGYPVHVALVFAGSSTRLYVGGVLVHTGSGTIIDETHDMYVVVGDGTSSGPASFSVHGFRVRQAEVYTGSSFAPPSVIPPPDGSTWIPQPEDLQDVLEAEALRCEPLTASQIDFSAAAGKEVWGFKASRSAAAEMGVLLDWYYLDIFCLDKLYVVERGGASEQTIAYGYTGAAIDGTSDPFAGLTRGADVESQFATSVQYINILADGEVDTQQGQRVGTGSEVRAFNFSIYSKPTLAKGRADTITHDTRVASHTATVRLGTRQAAKIQPASVLTLVDNKGNSYRTRVLRLVWNRGVYDADVCLDDPNILKDVGITTEVDTSVIEVTPPGETELLLLDIPILRDVDNDPGYYQVVSGSGDWHGARVFESLDGVTYESLGDITQSATTGETTTVLGDWPQPWLIDQLNSVTVTVNKALSSYTLDAVIAGTVPPYLIGDEIVYAMTATLVSPLVYTLSNFVRAVGGTEWTTGDHAIGDRVVVLQNVGIKRGEREAGELNIEYQFKGVSLGSSIDSVEAIPFTDTGIGLKPYAVVDMRADVESGATVVSWNRRSRLSSTFLGTVEPPLGEASESYDVELFDGASVVVSDTVTEPEWSVTAYANDFSLGMRAQYLYEHGGVLHGFLDSVSSTISYRKFALDGTHLAGLFVAELAVLCTAHDGAILYCGTSNGGDPGDLLRIDTSTVAITHSNPYGVASIVGVAFDGTDLWAYYANTGDLLRLDKDDLSTVNIYALGTGYGRMAYAAGSLWICDKNNDEVIEWDIATTAEVQRFSVPRLPIDIIVKNNLVFVVGAEEFASYTDAGVEIERFESTAHSIYRSALAEFDGAIAVRRSALINDSVALVSDTTGVTSTYLHAPGAYAVAGASSTHLFVATSGGGDNVSSTQAYASGVDISGYVVRVYQNSAIVGRGYVAELSL